MQLDFIKMHGLGNDFIMVDNLDGSIELTGDQVALLCDRHFGIGADGVILVEGADGDQDGFMNYINSDGTFAQMCGNGVRCFAKFLVDGGYVDADAESLSALTRAGVRDISFERTSDGKLAVASVDMGKPILEPAEIPVTLPANATSAEGQAFVKDAPIASPWGDLRFTMVSMGNPHAVCFIEDFDAICDALFTDASDKSLATLNVDMVGAFYESNGAFPEKTNVEFAQVGENGIDMRVFERGCGETLACGTGACATNVAAALTDRAPRRNKVNLLGGTLDIDWLDDGRVMMTGPAETSFSGTVAIDERSGA